MPDVLTPLDTETVCSFQKNKHTCMYYTGLTIDCDMTSSANFTIVWFWFGFLRNKVWYDSEIKLLDLFVAPSNVSQLTCSTLN